MVGKIEKFDQDRGFLICPDFFDSQIFFHSNNLVWEAWKTKKPHAGQLVIFQVGIDSYDREIASNIYPARPWADTEFLKSNHQS